MKFSLRTFFQNQLSLLRQLHTTSTRSETTSSNDLDLHAVKRLDSSFTTIMSGLVLYINGEKLPPGLNIEVTLSQIKTQCTQIRELNLLNETELLDALLSTIEEQIISKGHKSTAELFEILDSQHTLYFTLQQAIFASGKKVSSSFTEGLLSVIGGYDFSSIRDGEIQNYYVRFNQLYRGGGIVFKLPPLSATKIYMRDEALLAESGMRHRSDSGMASLSPSTLTLSASGNAGLPTTPEQDSFPEFPAHYLGDSFLQWGGVLVNSTSLDVGTASTISTSNVDCSLQLQPLPADLPSLVGATPLENGNPWDSLLECMEQQQNALSAPNGSQLLEQHSQFSPIDEETSLADSLNDLFDGVDFASATVVTREKKHGREDAAADETNLANHAKRAREWVGPGLFDNSRHTGSNEPDVATFKFK